MTYRELIGFLNELNDDQLETDVTVYVKDQDEFYPVAGLGITEDTDVLDEEHPYFVI